MSNFVVYSERKYHSRSVCIFMRHENGRESVAKPLIFEDCTDKFIETPTIGETRRGDGEAFLQACLDHAWEIGLRPSGFNDTTQQVAAIKSHLNDMRALVFKIDPPK
jgi:hypothetical protein